MARPLRILFEDAYYHVINRGQGKRDIFCDQEDYHSFQEILKGACQVYGVRIVAYCLMRNHYHLLVQTPKANLSDYMRQVNGVYTRIFNKRYKQDGTLFKGRYKAVVVQEGSYLLRLVRYIHNNPVRAGIVKDPGEYLYSSHKAYLEGKEQEWLRFKAGLKTQWKNEKDVKKAYREYMKKDDEELKEYLDQKRSKAVNAIIFGEEEYLDKIKTTYLNAKRLYGEIPEGKRLKDEINNETIKKAVKTAFKINEKELVACKRGKENIGRMLAIGLIRECSGYPYREIGQMFGGISYKSAAKYYERVKKRCITDKAFKKLFDDIKVTCSQVET